MIVFRLFSKHQVKTVHFVDFKPQTEPATTEKPTKKPKKTKRDADTPSLSHFDSLHSDSFFVSAPEDVCEELKDGQWPDPSDCKSYFLCRGVGTQWGEQKREVCYTGSFLISFNIGFVICFFTTKYFSFQALILIPMKKHVNGSEWTK